MERTIYDVAVEAFANNIGDYKSKCIIRTTCGDGTVWRWAASMMSYYRWTENGWQTRFDDVTSEDFQNWNIVKVEKFENDDWIPIWQFSSNAITNPDAVICVNGRYYFLKELSAIMEKLDDCSNFYDSLKRTIL